MAFDPRNPNNDPDLPGYSGPAVNLPPYDPNAPKPPERQSTIGSRLGERFRDLRHTPREVADYARDVARDPLREIAIATAPMMGMGQAVAAPAAAARSLRGIGATKDFIGNPSLATLMRASRPTAWQTTKAVAGATPTVGAAGLALAAEDRAEVEANQAKAQAATTAQAQPDKPQPIIIDNGQSRVPNSAFQYSPREDGIYRTTDANGNSVYSDSAKGLRGALAQANANRAGGFAFGEAGPGGNAGGQVDGGRNYANQLTRRGNQGATIKNPHGMSLEDRMRGLLTSMKGSPSMRKAAAEAMLAEQQNDYDSHQAALNRNDAAESEQMQAQLKANESYADRRLKADTFNQELGFRRRQLNDESILKASEIAVNARNGMMRYGADGTGRGSSSGAGKDPEATFISDRYKDVLEMTGNPDIALREANRMGAQAGVTVDNPITRYGQTADSDELNAARDAFSSRWTASSNPEFDPNTASPVKRTFVDRLETVFPGGVDPTDRKWQDANGNVDYTDPYAFSTGETPGAYALRRKRELAIRQMQEGK